MAPVAIIILNWNGYEDTRDCILSLQRCIDSNSFDIILIDNGSLRNEGEILQREFSHISLITNPKNLGFAAAVNQGIAYVQKKTYEYIILLNNDTKVKPDFFQGLYREVTQHAKVVCMPLILMKDSKSIQNVGARISLPLGLNIHLGKGKTFESITIPDKIDYLPFVCLASPLQAFQEVGLLDERYFAYYEDADWCVRAKRAGWNFIIVKDSQVEHQLSRSTSPDNKFGGLKAYLMARNCIYFVRKHYNFHRRLLVYISQFHIRLVFGMLKCSNLSARLLWLKGVYDGFRGDMDNDFERFH